jgi:hypothetical protein
MDNEFTNTPAPDDPPTPDKLREQVDALNQKAGDLSETLKRIDERLTEALGHDREGSKSD